MNFSVKISSLMFFCLLWGCLPHDDRGPLTYRDHTLSQPVQGRDDQTGEIEPGTYAYFHKHLFERSCLKCHNGRQTRLPQFDTEEKIKETADNIIFYMESGCDIGSCMPPVRDDGTATAPVPSPELVSAFKIWLESNL